MSWRRCWMSLIPKWNNKLSINIQEITLILLFNNWYNWFWCRKYNLVPTIILYPMNGQEFIQISKSSHWQFHLLLLIFLYWNCVFTSREDQKHKPQTPSGLWQVMMDPGILSVIVGPNDLSCSLAYWPHWPSDVSCSLAFWPQLLIGLMTPAAHWPNDLSCSLAFWPQLLIGLMISASHWPIISSPENVQKVHS